MKYIQYDEIGNPAEVLKVIEAPQTALASGEVRVTVLATPIHPSNLLQISGEYGVAPPLPAHPGAEGIGRPVRESIIGSERRAGQIESSQGNYP